MQAVLLAAGKSSRMYPFTTFPHKSCIPLLGKQIIEHTLQSVKEAGITDVVIVTGPDDNLRNTIGNGKDRGLTITYVKQKEPTGMGDGLLLAENLLSDSFFVLHAHHLEFASFARLLEEKKKKKEEAVILARNEESVNRFGVLKVKGDQVIDIVEKPSASKSPSNLRVIGIYLLSREFLRVLNQTPKDHYGFEQALAAFAKQGNVRVAITNNQVISLKYPWDLLNVNSYLMKRITHKVSPKATIAKSAQIIGDVIVGDGVTIMEGATIKGPAYIGKRTKIGNNAIIRGGVMIGERCVIGAGMEVKASVILDGTTTHSGYIGDSVIGRNCKIAAFFCSGNVRLDRKNISVEVNDDLPAGRHGKIDSQRRSLGVLMGDGVKVGIRVSTMPGVVIGNNVVVGPSTTVTKNISDNTQYYTRFKEIIEKKL